MRRAVLVLVAVALSFLTVPAWANHSVPTGVNCSNFAYQEDAQTYFEQHPGDPEGLDGPPGPTSSGVPGVACEDLPRRGTATTTTTTAPTTTTIPPSTTTVPPVTSTIVEPPTAILSASSGQVAGALGSFCWPQSGGHGMCRHVDYLPGQGPNPARTLTVAPGEVATLSFESAPPLATLRIGVVSPGLNPATLSAPVANPSRFTVDLSPGTHVIGVDATFSGGAHAASAAYYFKLEVVQAAAPPAQPSTARRLALTG